MKLVIIREPTIGAGTFGKLYINGLFAHHTLEDVDRRLEDGGKKVQNETAIPRGTYDVILDWSNRFKKEMMHVLNVPGFEGIRVHAGNSDKDTRGCVLLGNGRGNGFLLDSRSAVNKVFAAVDAAIAKGDKVTLEIK